MMATLHTAPSADNTFLDGLLSAIAQGNMEALETLYGIAATPVYSYALSILRSRYDAEDVLHAFNQAEQDGGLARAGRSGQIDEENSFFAQCFPDGFRGGSVVRQDPFFCFEYLKGPLRIRHGRAVFFHGQVLLSAPFIVSCSAARIHVFLGFSGLDMHIAGCVPASDILTF